MTTANLRLGAQCAAFLAVDFVAWFLSFSKLAALKEDRCPDIYASAEGCLACVALLCGVEVSRSLRGWKLILFVLACGAVPVIARRMT